MDEKHLTYEVLQREVKIELVRYTLLRGQGGPLVLLWSIGIAILTLLLDLPLVVLPWTAAIVGLGILAGRDYRKNRRVRALLLNTLIAKHFPTHLQEDMLLKEGLEKGREIFVEIALKIANIEDERKTDDELHRVLGAATNLLGLQYESAKQAEEFDRVLRIIGSGSRRNLFLPGDRASTTPRLHEENAEATEAEAAKARARAGEILQQLEILLLQVVRLEKQAGDIVRTAELAQETESLLGRMQTEVEAQRRAAQEVIGLLIFPSQAEQS